MGKIKNKTKSGYLNKANNRLRSVLGLCRYRREVGTFTAKFVVLLESIYYFSNILPDNPKIGTLSVYS